MEEVTNQEWSADPQRWRRADRRPEADPAGGGIGVWWHGRPSPDVPRRALRRELEEPTRLTRSDRKEEDEGRRLRRQPEGRERPE
jgi:hypothetical protein